MTTLERIIDSIPARGLEHTLSDHARTTLSLGKTAMEFTSVKRIPRLHTGEREDNAQHSFMVGLIAPQLAILLNEAKGYTLNPAVMPAYAQAHDLIELIVGDQPTFNLTRQQLKEKQDREHEAIDELCDRIGPYWASIVREYEEQQIPETRFVRAIDKAAPAIVDIYGQGDRIVSEDYDVRTKQELMANHIRNMRSLRERFPDYPEVIDICEELFRLFETVSSLPIQPHHSEVIRFCFSPEDNEMQPYGTSGIPRKQLF